MKTKDIVETLLFKIPDLRKAFLCLNIMSSERRISSVNHKEYNHLLSNFKNPKIISIVGLMQVTLLIEPVKNGRLYDVIIIRGNDCEVTQMSKTLIKNELISNLNWKDYLPEPFVKKIIYIDDYKNKENKLKLNINNNNNNSNNKNNEIVNVNINSSDITVSGIVFSEFEKNKWTLDNPLEVEIKNYRKITGKAIINEILSDLLNS